MAKDGSSMPSGSPGPGAAQSAAQSWRGKRNALWLCVALLGVLVIVAVLRTVLVSGANNSKASRIDHDVGALLSGIPQKGQTLGAPTAPVTLQVFAELEDPSTYVWFDYYLPKILAELVRTDRVKIEYRSFKTNTIASETFVKQQAAALAAGEQDKLWNYAYIFYGEQGKVRTPYVTEGYLDRIASQVPSLNLKLWDRDRDADPRIEQVVEEDQQGRAEGIHLTPAYRIGRTGRALRDFTGSTGFTAAGQTHVTTYASAEDIAKAIDHINDKN